MEEVEDAEEEEEEEEEEEKQSRSTRPGETASSKGSHRCDLGAQHVIILTVLCFHCQGIFGRRFTATGLVCRWHRKDVGA